MIVDSGCPCSLMGRNKLVKLDWINIQLDEVKSEKFRFGPSKVFPSTTKVKFPIKRDEIILNLEFFVIDSKVPILLGNDVLEPLDGSVNLEERKLVLAKLQKEVNLVKMPFGILLFLFGIWLWLKKILMKQTEEISTEMKQMKS